MTTGILDPLASYMFHVEVDGLSIAQFKEVDGLSIAIGVIEHRANTAGGQPILKKLPGSMKYEDIVLKRGKVNDPTFWTWIKSVQDGNIESARRNGSIVLINFQHGEVHRFNFQAGWPSKVDVGKLIAGSDTVLIETVTITHESLTVA
jgi:phage tail-like protein